MRRCVCGKEDVGSVIGKGKRDTSQFVLTSLVL